MHISRTFGLCLNRDLSICTVQPGPPKIIESFSSFQEQMSRRKLQQSIIDFWLTPTVSIICFCDALIDHM